MARKNRTDKLIDKSSITEELKLIPGSNTDYIDCHGNVYKSYSDTKFFPKKNTPNPRFTYPCVGVTMADGRNKTFRVHVLVGKLFLDNPHNYPCVCHKDDNKLNPDVTNLYWASVAKNTQDAFDHGLAVNAKGFEDSQSMPVSMFDLDGNHIQDYGSVSIAAGETGMTKTGILFQCRHLMKSKPRKGKQFRFKSEYDSQGFVL